MNLRSAFQPLHFVVVSFVLSNQAFSWGSDGHRMVNRVAAETMTSELGTFLKKNTEKLQDMSVIPDSKWKLPATKKKEGFTHFFQWDIYQDTDLSSSMPIILKKVLKILDDHELIENGTAVWRVNQIFNMLVKAIDDKKWPAVIQYAGTLGHYVGDLSQPMHITSDYDGQSIGKKGIHSRFESALVQKQDQDQLHQKVYDAAIRLRRDSSLDEETEVIDTTWKEGKRALKKMPALLDEYSETDPNETKLVKVMVSSMADGAKTLGVVLDQACEKARKCESFPKTIQKVSDPAWSPVEIKVSEFEETPDQDH